MATGNNGNVTKENTDIAVAETVHVDIRSLIYVVRGQQVMLDSDLAMLYQVETKRLNEAVKRNIVRFPEEFRFQLNVEELTAFSSLTKRLPTILAHP